ncbi:MAG: hypothetical protein PHZ09_13430, partial [Eubacteriales bacterium]|nr:hypothetical protein [Eubacteriales bacterium]
MKMRITAILLLVSILAVTACSDKTPNDAVLTTALSEETIPEDVDSLAERQKVSDGIETEDFDGKSFHIIGDDACTD